MGMLQKEYDEIIASKRFINAMVLNELGKMQKAIVYPSTNAGVLDPVIEFKPTIWMYFSTYLGRVRPGELIKKMSEGLEVTAERFEINGEKKTARQVYEMVKAL